MVRLDVWALPPLDEVVSPTAPPAAEVLPTLDVPPEDVMEGVKVMVGVSVAVPPLPPWAVLLLVFDELASTLPVEAAELPPVSVLAPVEKAMSPLVPPVALVLPTLPPKPPAPPVPLAVTSPLVPPVAEELPPVRLAVWSPLLPPAAVMDGVKVMVGVKVELQPWPLAVTSPLVAAPPKPPAPPEAVISPLLPPVALLVALLVEVWSPLLALDVPLPPVAWALPILSSDNESDGVVPPVPVPLVT